MQNSTKGLFGDQRGAFAPLFGLLLIPLIGFMGLAIDTSRYYAVKQQLQQSIDSAVLAGGRSISSPDRNLIIQRYFDNNWKTGRYGAIPSVLTIVASAATGKITLSATADVPLLLMPILLGYDAAVVDAVSEITRTDSTLEAALVLDISGSMGGAKIAALRTASKLLVDILYPSAAPDPKIYISIVPWDHNVIVGSGYNAWVAAAPPSVIGGLIPWAGTTFCPMAGGAVAHTGRRFNQDYVGQMRMRSNPNDLNEKTPAQQIFSTFSTCTHTDLYNGAALVCTDLFMQCQGNRNTLIPLRNDPTFLKARLDGLQAAGATDSMTGLFWGWMTISPNWQGWWSGVPAAMPKAYAAPDHYKAVVLMTDGLNNNVDGAYNPLPPGTTPGNSMPNVVYVNARSVTACNLMKAEGIRIYTVGFDLTSLSPAWRAIVEAYLKGCASSPSNYFPAPTPATLVSVFSAIASDLASLRISY